MKLSKIVIAVSLTLVAGMAQAITPAETLDHYAGLAKKENASFKAFDAEAGKTLYFKKAIVDGKEHSCASCHTDDPRKSGKNPQNNKVIKPMAPSANPERFTDLKETEKWFGRTCKKVLTRDCTSQEKGDFISYLLTVK